MERIGKRERNAVIKGTREEKTEIQASVVCHCRTNNKVPVEQRTQEKVPL